MKKISSIEFERIKRSRPHIKRTGAMLAVMELGIGHAMMIDKDEWKMKRKNVVVSIHSLARSDRLETGVEKRFRVKTLPDGSGWAVYRTI